MGYSFCILFPIPFWKLFFKNINEREKAFIKDLKQNGYDVIFDENNENETAYVKNQISPVQKVEIQEKLNKQFQKQMDTIKLDKQLISTNKTEVGEYIVQVNLNLLKKIHKVFVEQLHYFQILMFQ